MRSTTVDFDPSALSAETAAHAARWRCPCAFHARRRFGALVLGGAVGSAVGGPAAAAIPECRRSSLAQAVPADQVEQGAAQQYRQMMQEAAGQRALAPAEHPQVQRLRFIAQRMIPFTPECNERAAKWKWEVNLLGSAEVNAFCMPGGKIAFFYGILSKLQLDDNEVAMIMGHETAHALLEHAREQMSKNTLTQGALRLGAALLGLGNVGDFAAQMGAQLLSLTYSRNDESQADALGLVMAAQAGYDPRAGVTLWKKMLDVTGGRAPPKLLSTHPAGPDRIRDIESRLPAVMPVFERAPKPGRRFEPPPPAAPQKPK